MHRWTLLASAFALLGLTSVSATPFNPAEFGGRDQGYLVPGVYFTSAADTSAVGLTNTCNAHQVHWVFTDTSGTVQGRGSFTILPTETRPFVLAQALPASAVGRFGTLMFVSDTDGDGKLTSADEQCLVVEAFHADLTRNDAVFLPVWPFNTYDFPGGPGTGINDLSIMVPGMLSRLSSGIEDEPGADVRTIYLRYSIGGGDATRMVVWSAETVTQPLLSLVSQFDGSKAELVPITLPGTQLSVLDVGTLGFPSGLTNGLIAMVAPDDGVGDYADTAGDGNGIAAYTVIESPSLGAAQTILATWSR